MAPTRLKGQPDAGTPSSAYEAMLPDLELIESVLGGLRVIQESDNAALFLPRYGEETTSEYARRLMSSPWRPEFEDILRSLASKPFSKDVTIQGETSGTIRAFAEDVDTLGTNLHRFAAEVFYRGLATGYHGILVDYPVMSPGVTLDDERGSGARPYWVHLPAKSIIALYTETIAGKTIVTHLRYSEMVTRRVGYGEETVERVRVFEPGRWETWERNKKGDMQMVEDGVFALDHVPIALFYAGRRNGEIVRPPLLDLAHMQIELFRALSRQEEILTFAGSPMLAANGMTPPPPILDGDGNLNADAMAIQIGPKRVLFAPPPLDGGATPSWEFIQPAAANIAEIRLHIQSVIDDMRRLGMQPLTPRMGTITATGAGIEAAKAHSAVQAWSMGLKDALEQALVFTSEWYGESTTAEVFVHSDFGLEVDGGEDADALLKARVAGELSRETYWDEMLRRGKLGPQFEPEEEKERLAVEAAALALAMPSLDDFESAEQAA